MCTYNSKLDELDYQTYSNNVKNAFNVFNDERFFNTMQDVQNSGKVKDSVRSYLREHLANIGIELPDEFSINFKQNSPQCYEICFPWGCFIICL